jgi:hypothetical protein
MDSSTCPPGGSGNATCLASSAKASLRTTLAAQCGIFAAVSVPMAGRAVRAAESRFPVPQFLAAAASALATRRGTQDSIISVLRRPQTLCAFQLGEPSRAPKHQMSYVARRCSRGGSSSTLAGEFNAVFYQDS